MLYVGSHLRSPRSHPSIASLEGAGHPWIPPPPLKFPSLYTVESVIKLCTWSQKPPETVSEVVNFEIFLGKHAPRPPSTGMDMLEFPPGLQKNSVLIPTW